MLVGAVVEGDKTKDEQGEESPHSKGLALSKGLRKGLSKGLSKG
jgi:hypothetical protein